VYARSDQLKEKVFDVKLQLNEWKVLFAVDGKMDERDIASLLEMPGEEVQATLEKLAGLQFISGNGELAAETAEAEEAFTFEETLESTEIIEEAVDEAVDEPLQASEAETSTGEEDVAFDLDNLLPEEETSESAGEETGEIDEDSETDEDIDALIGDILEEDAETESDDISGDALDQAETLTEEDEFDLGSIFEDDVLEAETSTEELLGELEDTDVETTIETPVEKVVTTGQPATILVVDDSVVIRKMVEIALENEDYNIVSVSNGKDALSYLDENTPDLIILDIMLSDVNGLDVLKAIKSSKDIPVVMLSAKDTPRETSKAKQLGADDFIPKPFKDEELVGKIKDLIKQ